MGVTEKQAKAINFENGNALVSASAGSGKTFVMISRVVKLIIEGKADVSEILCVTFTSKAAAEMKQKLYDKINEEIAKCSADQPEKAARLYAQLEELPTAQISTVHSFCKNLLSEFFYQAGLDAAFAVADEKESELLVNRAIDRLFEDLYEQGDGELNLLLSCYFKKRSDVLLKKRIVGLYRELITERSITEILKKGEFYYTEAGVKSITEKTINDFSALAKKLLNELDEIRFSLDKNGKLEKFAAELSAHLNNFTYNDDYDDYLSAINQSALRFPPKSKAETEPEYVREDLRAFYYGSFKPFIELIKTGIGEPLEEEISRAKKAAPVYSALCSAVNKFADYYAEEKRAENVVDFSDLEHLTLKLLENDEIRREVSARFKYVFADEYQDTNGVQEELLKRLTENNLFMVGDVKQSIYNFRGCNPDIFADKFDEFSAGDADEISENGKTENAENAEEKCAADGNAEKSRSAGTAISLDKNFRSAAPVLNAVNNVFKAVFDKDFGRVEYSKSPMEFGGGYPENEGSAEAIFVARPKAEKTLPSGVYGVVKHLDVLKKSDGFPEGRLIAELIESLAGTEFFCVKEKTYKKLDYGDFCLLLRNTKNSGDKYVSELIRAGIPVAASSRKSIGEYPEIAFLTEFLKLIGCFNQDIPLVATLKSPIGGLCESELLEIRNFCKKGSFCEAYRAYLKKYDEEKTCEEREAAEADENNADSLFAEGKPAYKPVNGTFDKAESGLAREETASGETGAAREKAAETDELFVKLKAFDDYIKKIRLLAAFMPCDELLNLVIKENKIDIEYLSARLGAQKIERINAFIDAAGAKKRTVAEFLQVMDGVVEDLTLDYSDENAVKIMSIHASKGLEFPVVILGGADKKYNAEDLKSDMLVDKNYGVALKLNDVADGTQKDTILRKFVRRLKQKTMREEEARLLYVALTRAENRLYITGSVSEKEGEAENPLKPCHRFTDGVFSSAFTDLIAQTDMPVSFKTEADFEIFKERAAKRVLIGDPDEYLKEKIKSNLSFKYPFAADENISVKRSVTAAAHFDEENAPAFEYAPIFGSTGQETGTAYHKFLQYCDFSLSPESAINGLIAAHLMTEEELSLIDENKIKRILQMPIFEKLRGYDLYKEQPFTAYLPAKLTEPDYSGDEQVLVQGIIDLLAIKGDEAIIADYKFSSLARSEDLVLRYEKQLRLYALAVKKVLNKKIVGLYLVNIYSAKQIPLSLDFLND